MKHYSSYIEHYAKAFFVGGRPVTRADRLMFQSVSEALKEFVKHKEMLKAFYLGHPLPVNWKIVKEFESRVAQIRGLI